MRKYRPIYLTFKQCTNIVQCMNIIATGVVFAGPFSYCVISRKLYIKLIEYYLIDDICCNVVVGDSFHSPFPYAFVI